MRSGMLTSLTTAAAALIASAGTAHADDRFAVVHVTNNTDKDMSFYRTWVWNPGSPQQQVEVSWRMTKIPPGKTMTVQYQYQAAAKRSPELIVVYDSDRNDGAHWEMVKLARDGSPDFRDRRAGYHYTLDYENNRKEFASLRARNGGRVEILDRNATRPSGAQHMPFRD